MTPPRGGRGRVLASSLVVGALTSACLAACTAPSRDEPATTSGATDVPPPRSLPPTTEDGATPGGAASSTGPTGERDGKPRNTPGVERGAVATDAARLPRQRVSCPAPSVEVSDADQLVDALASADPGDVISLAPGTYGGAFVADRSGTASDPIWLCGGADVVLEGRGVRSGYVLHLDGATNWRLVGFTVRNGQKGVMADGTVGSVIQDLTVDTIGDEAIHLRRHSTDNLVIGNRVGNTGLRRDKFGEGVYIGTAISNWCTITACEPDRSDRNVVAENVFGATTSENVDIKEGTVGGLLVGNRFEGSGVVAADSLVDVKGTAWLIEGNRGANAPFDGFQTHQIEERWGERNLFRDNTVVAGTVPDELDDDQEERFGFAFRPEGQNTLTCDNRVSGGIRLATQACASP